MPSVFVCYDILSWGCIVFTVARWKRGRRFVIGAISKLTLIVVLIVVLTLLPMVRLMGENKDLLKAKFIGQEAEYQGVLTVWNIDTFEGGNLPKSVFLQNVAAKYEKFNKCALIKVTLCVSSRIRSSG